MGNLKFAFKSLYSNQVIIDERKNKPWWLALIMFVLSLIIVGLPTFISGMTAKGSSIITSKSNQIDVGLGLLSRELVSPSRLLWIDETSGELVYDDQIITPSNAEGEVPTPMKISDKAAVFTGPYVNAEGKTSTVTYLNVYFFPELDDYKNTDDAKTMNSIINDKILAKDKEDSNTLKNVPVSFMILTRTTIRLYVYPIVGATTSSTTVGAIQGVFSKLKGFSFNDAETGLATVDSKKALANWSVFFDKAYEPIKVSKTWLSTGVMVGISAVVTVFVGLLLFVMTRGKSNVIRDTSFLQALGMGIYLAPTCALISSLLSLVMASMASMGFLLCIGVRAMFLMMKTSGGYGKGDEKPVYQARS